MTNEKLESRFDSRPFQKRSGMGGVRRAIIGGMGALTLAGAPQGARAGDFWDRMAEAGVSALERGIDRGLEDQENARNVDRERREAAFEIRKARVRAALNTREAKIDANEERCGLVVETQRDACTRWAHGQRIDFDELKATAEAQLDLEETVMDETEEIRRAERRRVEDNEEADADVLKEFLHGLR